MVKVREREKEKEEERVKEKEAVEVGAVAARRCNFRADRPCLAMYLCWPC